MIIVITKNPCYDAASIKERFWCECECERAAQVVLIKMKDAGYGWRKCCWAGPSLSVWLGEGHLDVGEGWERTCVCARYTYRFEVGGEMRVLHQWTAGRRLFSGDQSSSTLISHTHTKKIITLTYIEIGTERTELDLGLDLLRMRREQRFLFSTPTFLHVNITVLRGVNSVVLITSGRCWMQMWRWIWRQFVIWSLEPLSERGPVSRRTGFVEEVCHVIPCKRPPPRKKLPHVKVSTCVKMYWPYDVTDTKKTGD